MIKSKKHFQINPNAWLFLAVVYILIAFPSQGICSDIEEGQILVNKIWSNLKERKMDELNRMIAPGFQLVHKKGIRNQGQEIEYLKGLYINNYNIRANGKLPNFSC